MRVQKPWLALTAVALSIAAAAAPADSGPPSDESIHKIFEVTHIGAMLDTYMAQMKTSIRAGMQQAMAGQPLNDKQRQIMNDMGDRMVGLVQERLDLPGLESQITQVYRDTYTQKDVDAMLAFYRSPTGQKVIAKQGLVMQQMSEYAIGRMKDVLPQVQQLQRDTAAQLQAAGSGAAPAPDATPADAPAPAAAAGQDSRK